jgi:hypothetical protein
MLDPDARKVSLRVTKPGGYIGDLEMSWKKEPDKKMVKRSYELWDGFSTKSFDEWRDFYKKMGLVDIKVNDFSESLKSMGKLYIRWLGIKGIIKIIGILLTNSGIRKGMVEYNKFFKEGKDYIGYGYFVGRKK